MHSDEISFDAMVPQITFKRCKVHEDSAKCFFFFLLVMFQQYKSCKVLLTLSSLFFKDQFPFKQSKLSAKKPCR